MLNMETMETIADRLAVTARVAEIFKSEFENERNCPFVSELNGMTLLLKAMGIPFEFTYDEEVKHITAVTVGTEEDSATVIL